MEYQLMSKFVKEETLSVKQEQNKQAKNKREEIQLN